MREKLSSLLKQLEYKAGLLTESYRGGPSFFDSMDFISQHKSTIEKELMKNYFVSLTFLGICTAITEFVFYDIPDKLRDIKHFFNFRIYHKLDVVKFSSTNSWKDTDEQMEAILEKLLIDFVEIECDHMYRITKDNKKLSKTKNYGIAFLKSDLAEYRRRAKKMPKIFPYLKAYEKDFKDITETYNYFKKVKPILQKEIQDEKEAKIWLKLEKVLEKKDTLYYTKLIKFRKRLWS